MIEDKIKCLFIFLYFKKKKGMIVFFMLSEIKIITLIEREAVKFWFDFIDSITQVDWYVLRIKQEETKTSSFLKACLNKLAIQIKNNVLKMLSKLG